jgi:hypothetical protein
MTFTFHRRETVCWPLFLLAAVLAGGGCGIPVVPFTLVPVPRAGDGDPPVKAQVRRVAVTGDLLGAGSRPDENSRLQIEIDVYNADPQRSFDLGLPRVRTQAALGGPVSQAGVLTISELGLRSKVTSWPSRPANVGSDWPVRLTPGQTRTFSVAYDGLSPCDAGGPLRILLTIPVVGQPALEMVLAAPVADGVRWRDDRAPAVLVWGGSWTTLSGSGGSLLEPLGLGIFRSKGRLVCGWQQRFGMLYRDRLASGPPAVAWTQGMHLGWHPWRFPVGVYASAAVLFGLESPPVAYQGASGRSTDFLLLPRLSAGVIFNAGSPLTGATLLPVDQPRSAMRRFAVRVG